MKKKVLALIICLISSLISILLGEDISGNWFDIPEAVEIQWDQIFDVQEEGNSP